MNYRHQFHAGGFSDVLKHMVLIRLIQAFAQKETPFCYLDTHAGKGLYDLTLDPKASVHDSMKGIAKLMPSKRDCPQAINQYLTLVENCHYPDFYPGSPWIASLLMRKNDRLILNELNPEECKELKRQLKQDLRVAIHQQNGFQALKAFLPPKENRGLILMDPAFEKEEEWDRLIISLKEGLAKFPSGVYALWYPLKDKKIVKQFLNTLRALELPKLFNIQLSIYPDDTAFKLFGSGMVIINAPWKFEEDCRQWLPWLWERLSISSAGGYYIGPEEKWPMENKK